MSDDDYSSWSEKFRWTTQEQQLNSFLLRSYNLQFTVRNSCTSSGLTNKNNMPYIYSSVCTRLKCILIQLDLLTNIYVPLRNSLLSSCCWKPDQHIINIGLISDKHTTVCYISNVTCDDSKLYAYTNAVLIDVK